MFHKGKLLVFLGSLVIILYGASAIFIQVFAKEESAFKEISVFMDVLDKVVDDYVEDPDMDKVQEGAMRGLINALDSNSSFLSKEQYEALQSRKEAGTAGAGMILSKRTEVIYIVSCAQDGPATQMEIRPGDYLIAVDGQPVEEKSILEVNSLLRGAPGSKLMVEIFRSSRSKPLKMELTLETPSPVTVKTNMTDENIGILDISSIADSSQIEMKLKELIADGAEKLVLDLRDCADGEPADGAALANFFLRDGVLYSSQNRLGEMVQVVKADPARFITDLPLAVLINSSTAWAAEITTGALKDSRRATVVGEKSFGIGSAQETITLKSGAILVLTTAKYYTPGGKVIQDEKIRDAGIDPDINVPDNDTRQDLVVESHYDDQDEAMKYRKLRDKIDQIQIEKALEVLADESTSLKEAA